MLKHFRRKKLCEYIDQEITMLDCIQMLDEGKLKIKRKKILHVCQYCSKRFDRQKRLESHEDICDNKENMISKMKKMEDKMIELQKQMTASGTVNTNSHNTTNNNVSNTFNINVTAFKDTNYMAVKDRIMKCLQDQEKDFPQLQVPAFEKIIDAVHFDKENPENHNIYKPNVRDDRILTYNGEEFVIDKMAIDVILKKLEEVIDNSVDKEEGKEYLKRLKNHLKLKQQDNDYHEATKDDIAISLYNGRNIVKNTINKIKK
jgi:hypothetical protein